MRVQTMAAIRNARGLTADDKAMLYTTESRGEVFATADIFRQDCGMGKNKFYATRSRLDALGLLDVRERRPKGTTCYRVNHDAVAALAEPMSPPVGKLETPMSLPVGALERDTNVTPGRDANVTPGRETKRTFKGTPKGTLKEWHYATSLVRVSDLPSLTESECAAVAAHVREEGRFGPPWNRPSAA